MSLRKIKLVIAVVALMVCAGACTNQENEPSQTPSVTSTVSIEPTPSVTPIPIKTRKPETVIATVGEKTVTESELKFYFNINKQRIESEAGLEGKSDEEINKFWDETAKQDLLDETLEDLHDVEILLMLAEENNVMLEQEDLIDIQTNVQRFIEELAEGDETKAEEVMQDMYGISVDEYRWVYEDYLNAYDKYAFTETSKIQVSDAEIEKEFEENKQQYKNVNVKHVLIYSIDTETQEPLAETTINQRKLLAESIYKRAMSGEAIEDLAKQYSEDADTKDIGGELTFGRDDTVSEFEEWAFAAKEGDFGFITTSYGFHVVKFVKDVEPTLGDKEKNIIIRYIQNKKFETKV